MDHIKFPASLIGAENYDHLPALDEYTDVELWDLARSAQPGITEQEFAQDWEAIKRFNRQSKLH